MGASEGDMMLRMCVNCGASSYVSTPRRSPPAMSPQIDNDLLNMSPQPFGRQSFGVNISAAGQHAEGQLINQISCLEHEIMVLEQFILSRYRAIFQQCLPVSPPITNKGLGTRSISMNTGLQEVKGEISYNDKNRSSMLESIEREKFGMPRYTGCSSSPDLAISNNKSIPLQMEDPKNEVLKNSSEPRSLADHLGVSLSEHVADTPVKLSQDIIRCMCSIYCEFGHPISAPINISFSPTSSLSSPSTFSPQDPCDSWSPRCKYEFALTHDQMQMLEEHHPGVGLTEVLDICIDSDRYESVAKVLETFRALIQRLEMVDPKLMNVEENLAFWINIHNALVMHAFLAYSHNQSHLKSTFAVLKPAYNVGGQSINAYVIQGSILRCHPLHPAPWQSFSTMLKPRNDRHAYALDRREPLVYFALCSGARSDPAVRVYKAETVIHDLEYAKEEYIQTRVYIYKERKIVLPKPISNYAKDTPLTLPGLIEMIHSCLPKAQQKSMQKILPQRLGQCIQWSPYDSSFRYLIHSVSAK